MRMLAQDIRYGARIFAKQPGFTAAAVLTLTLGIGATTLIFSVADGVLLRPLPFPEPDRLVALWNDYPQLNNEREPVSPPDFCDWLEQNGSFAQLAAYEQFFYNLAGDPNPLRLGAARVSGGFFTALGVRPLWGRPLLPSDDHKGAHRVVVMSHRLWISRFGSDLSILGQAVTLNGTNHTIVGIMPAGFEYPGDVDLWSPLAYDPPFEPSLRRIIWLRTVARLKPGVTLAQAQADMSSIAQRLAQQYPETNTGRGVLVVSLHEQTVGDVRAALLVLLAAVGCLLMIACTNVANLLLARAAGRQREIAVRTALGAGRFRLARQLLTESNLLGLLGGAGGILLAMWGLELIKVMNPVGIPRLQEIHLDLRVLGFTILVSLATGVAVGVAPALMATRTHFFEGIRQSGTTPETRRGRRLRSILIVSEVALAQLLLIGGGLLFQSFLRLKSVDPGFNPGGILVSRLDLLSERYDQRSARLLFYHRALERLSALPGMQSAALSTTIPFDEMQLGFEFVIEGRPRPLPSQYPSAGYNSITPDYFRTMGIRLLAGRHFTDADREDSPAAVIINKAMASRFWPGESPIGRRIELVSDESSTHPPSMEIVGVVENVRQQGLDADVRSELYLPYSQRPWRSCFLLVRSDSEAGQLATALRHEIREIDPNIALSRLQSMNQYLEASIDAPRFRTFLLTVFAVLALLLAATGIFGVISYSVAQRTRDFGIRLALGALPHHLFKLVAGREFLVVPAGIGLGTLLSAVLTRYLTSLLFGVAPHDTLTFATVIALCGSVALAACYIPSRRIMEVDPLVALRDE